MPELPPKDPITDRPMAGLVLISVFILLLTVSWSLYDEFYGLRPWRNYQAQFSSAYSNYLDKEYKQRKTDEQKFYATPEYQKLMADVKSATEAAQKANAIVYVILIADRAFYGGGSFNLGDSGARDMDRLASDTGGRVINVGHDGKKLEDAFRQIQDELRTQYLASYTPTDPKADGTYRKLDLSCGKNLKVQTRKGYYAISSIDTQ